MLRIKKLEYLDETVNENFYSLELTAHLKIQRYKKMSLYYRL
jgi:hypothetical protein